MAVVDPVAFAEHRLSDLPLFSYLRQEGRFTVDHSVENAIASIAITGLAQALAST